MRDILIGAETLLTREPFGRFLPAAYEIRSKLHFLKNHQRSKFGLRGIYHSFAAPTNRAIPVYQVPNIAGHDCGLELFCIEE